MSTAAAPSNYVFWLAGRSAGVVAMLLVAVSVILGLSMAARVLPTRFKRDAARMHQHLALLSIGAIGAHGLLLGLDPWLKAGAKGILVPFAIGYRPLWTGLGIIGGYLAVILGLSFYVRRKIGVRLWRRMHRFTVLVYVLSLVHALGAGTDASIPAVRYAMLASTLPVMFLFALRFQRSRTRPAADRQVRDAEVPEVRRALVAAAPSGASSSARALTRPRGHLEARSSQAS